MGNKDVTDPVTVIWRVVSPPNTGPDVETELGRTTWTAGIAAGGFAEIPFDWTPDKSGHVCVKAEVLPVAGELNQTANNSAQENLTQWFSGASSPFKPVVVAFQTKNPYSDRDIDVRINVPSVPRGWSVKVDEVAFRLEPSESKMQTATITPLSSYLLATSDAMDRGFVPSFAANIVAMTPVSDRWVPLGVITEIVHPVNERGRLTATGVAETPTMIIVNARLETAGPMKPPLGGREVNVRMTSGTGKDIWKTGDTDAAGRLQLKVNVAAPADKYTLQAYYVGGDGVNAAVSKVVKVH
jgi:hypothetical protein